jgi:hypothetical protein
MCEYSLRVRMRSRSAKVDDHLELRRFTACTSGFVHVGPRGGLTLVCLMPGTEVLFDEPPVFLGTMTWVERDGVRRQEPDRATVREARTAIMPNGSGTSRSIDGVWFADGKGVGFISLEPGVHLRVLQIPAKPLKKRGRVRIVEGAGQI